MLFRRKIKSSFGSPQKPAKSLEKIEEISCATSLDRFNTQRVAGLNALTKKQN